MSEIPKTYVFYIGKDYFLTFSAPYMPQILKSHFFGLLLRINFQHFLAQMHDRVRIKDIFPFGKLGDILYDDMINENCKNNNKNEMISNPHARYAQKNVEIMGLSHAQYANILYTKNVLSYGIKFRS